MFDTLTIPIVIHYGLKIMRQIKHFVSLWLIPPGLTEILAKQLQKMRRNRGKSLIGYKELDFEILKKYGTRSEVASFPIENMRYQGGRRFSIDEHHMVRFYDEGDSALRNFYEMHQPKNCLEEHFCYNNADMSSIVLPPVGLLPWSRQRKKFFGEKGLSEAHGHQAYGPASEKKINLEAKRLTRILESINRYGYQPELFGGYPRGQLLVDDANTPVRQHFLISSGQHRLAALSYLGFGDTFITFEAWLPREIRISDIDNWPGVSVGTFTKEVAQKIFYTYFAAKSSNLLES